MTGNSKFYIYFHRSNITNEVFYVGKGNDRRAFSSSGRNNFWHRVVRKHGYSVSLTNTGLTESQAFALEMEYIAQFGRRNVGTGSLVNLTSGGEGPSGVVHSEEWKRNVSAKLKGRVFSEEHKRKQTAAKIGRKRSDEMRRNLSNAKKGTRLTEEHKAKLRITSAARRHTTETRKKMSEVQKLVCVKKWKSVVQMSLDGAVIAAFSSITEAERVTGANRSVITKCCKNLPNYNTAGGFKWKYA